MLKIGDKVIHPDDAKRKGVGTIIEIGCNKNEGRARILWPCPNDKYAPTGRRTWIKTIKLIEAK